MWAAFTEAASVEAESKANTTKSADKHIKHVPVVCLCTSFMVDFKSSPRQRTIRRIHTAEVYEPSCCTPPHHSTSHSTEPLEGPYRKPIRHFPLLIRGSILYGCDRRFVLASLAITTVSTAPAGTTLPHPLWDTWDSFWPSTPRLHWGCTWPQIGRVFQFPYCHTI